MEYIPINGTNLKSSSIGLGTWAMGGWMWGGTDETQSIRTIHAAFEKGINLIDTAPVYCFGRSEEIVGRAIEQWGTVTRLLSRRKSAWIGKEARRLGTAPANVSRRKLRTVPTENSILLKKRKRAG